MELQLGLSLPLHTHPIHGAPTNCIKHPCITNELPNTSPLLSWNDKPKNEDDPDRPGDTCSCAFQMDEEKNHGVGWPPIGSWRKKVLDQLPHPPQTVENRRPITSENNNQNGGLNFRMT